MSHSKEGGGLRKCDRDHKDRKKIKIKIVKIM